MQHETDMSDTLFANHPALTKIQARWHEIACVMTTASVLTCKVIR